MTTASVFRITISGSTRKIRKKVFKYFANIVQNFSEENGLTFNMPTICTLMPSAMIQVIFNRFEIQNLARFFENQYEILKNDYCFIFSLDLLFNLSIVPSVQSRLSNSYGELVYRAWFLCSCSKRSGFYVNSKLMLTSFRCFYLWKSTITNNVILKYYIYPN